MARAARESVEFPDQDAVDLSVSCSRHQGVELRTAFSTARHSDIAVVPDDMKTGAGRVRSKTVILQVRLLICGRDSQIESREGSVRCLGWPAFSSIKVFLCGH